MFEYHGFEHAYNQGAYAGLARAVAELGVAGRVLTPAPREGFAPSLAFLARQRYDLVIATGFWAVSAVDAVARRFPATRFATIDAAHDALAGRPDNVLGLCFAEDEVGYLAGFLAGRMATPRDGERVVSAVGGEQIPSVELFIAGYRAGVAAADPDVRVLVGYTDDFGDAAKGRTVARSQVARGSTVIFQVAGACGMGALEAAREHGVWGIGVDVDQSALGRHILTSAVKRTDDGVYWAVERLLSGRLRTGETVRFGLRAGGVALGTVSPVVPEAVLAELHDVERRVAAGGVPTLAGR